jgi:hypothetical protein
LAAENPFCKWAAADVSQTHEKDSWHIQRVPGPDCAPQLVNALTPYAGRIKTQ